MKLISFKLKFTKKEKKKKAFRKDLYGGIEDYYLVHFLVNFLFFFFKISKSPFCP